MLLFDESNKLYRLGIPSIELETIVKLEEDAGCGRVLVAAL